MKTGHFCLSLALLSAVPHPLLGPPSKGFCQWWGDWATVATSPAPQNPHSNPSHLSLAHLGGLFIAGFFSVYSRTGFVFIKKTKVKTPTYEMP